MTTSLNAAIPEVLRLAEVDPQPLEKLLAAFRLRLVRCADGQAIPGSYWGDDEAGLQDACLHARGDTPLHSILHEACHYICVTPERRCQLDTNAGSDNAEENAVCYLQVVLASHLACMGDTRMFADMDAWGYSFRLGSSRSWFTTDADDARQWLQAQQLLDADDRLLWRLRG